MYINCCPFCSSKKPMVKAGKAYFLSGTKQKHKCVNRGCYRITVNPIKVKK